MKRIDILKKFIEGIEGPSGIHIEIDDDMNMIPVENAIIIWEKMNEEIPDKGKSERPVKEKKQKEKLDDGKIHALKNAGWSVEKIADEMGCSVATIYSHLRHKSGKENE